MGQIDTPKPEPQGDAAIRLRCMELAVQMSPTDRSYPTVAGIAQKVYDFCNAQPVVETQPVTVDKPGRKKLTLPEAKPHA